MSILERLKSIYASPSIRQDADYSQEIGGEARTGVALVYRDLYDEQGPYSPHQKEEWMDEVGGDLKHLHHDLLAFLQQGHRTPFQRIWDFLLSPSTPTEAFLDFLELSLRRAKGYWAIFPNRSGDDFVEALNFTLDRHSAPYLLTPFAYEKSSSPGTVDQWIVTAYPRAYLRQSGAVEREVMQPALSLLSDPAYASSNADFRKALDRQRSGDFDGVATSCVATLEGVIKVTAAKQRIREALNKSDCLR